METENRKYFSLNFSKYGKMGKSSELFYEDFIRGNTTRNINEETCTKCCDRRNVRRGKLINHNNNMLYAYHIKHPSLFKPIKTLSNYKYDVIPTNQTNTLVKKTKHREEWENIHLEHIKIVFMILLCKLKELDLPVNKNLNILLTIFKNFLYSKTSHNH